MLDVNEGELTTLLVNQSDPLWILSPPDISDHETIRPRVRGVGPSDPSKRRLSGSKDLPDLTL